MRTIITICIDDKGNIEVNYPSSLKASTTLKVMEEVLNIIHRQHKEEQRKTRLYNKECKAYKKLIEKQKPELN
jgi:hypothetical protein